MRECDIIVVCSRKEGFGRAAVEGMLLEKPVVYTAVGGMLEAMVDGETGLSYPPEDVDRLVVQIEKLIANPDCGRALAKRARNYAAERFSRDSYGGKVFRELLDLLSGSATQLPMPRILISSLVSGLQDAQRIFSEREVQLRAAEAALEDVQRVANEQQSLLAKKDAQIIEAEHRAEVIENTALEDVQRIANEQQSLLAKKDAQIIEAEHRAEVIENATFWRVTHPLRRMASRWPPGFRRAVRGSAKLAWWSLTLRLPRKLRQRQALLRAHAAAEKHDHLR